MSDHEDIAKDEETAVPDDGDDDNVTSTSTEVEKQEEEKLKAKFPMVGRPMSGHSVFLQKRLATRQKYFDSGDYQMARQKAAAKARPAPAGIGYATGEAIPTPESVPVRKTSIIQPCKFTPSSTT